MPPREPPPPAPGLDVLPEPLRRLAERGEPRHVRKGALLIEEGSHGDTLFVILRGRLRAFSRGEREREITYGLYGPGDYVGEMSLDGGPRSASVEALEPTDCVMVTRVTLQRHIADHPEFAFELLAKVIRRARAATLSARRIALEDAYARLRTQLDALAEPVDGARRIAPRPTHRDLAAQIGSSREMVTRLLRDLEAGGYLVDAGAHWVLARELPARW